MPDLPPVSYSLASLIGRLRGQPPADYSYAQSRLGRQPMIYAQSPEQFQQLRGSDYGATYQPDMSQRAMLVADPSAGPLADPVRRLLGETGQPVSVIAPYQAPTPGNAGQPGTEPGVPLHESTHQYIGANKLPVGVFYTQVPQDIQGKIYQALTARNYTTDKFGDEIPARLAAGQYSSLGLSPEEGKQLWQTYLGMYQKMAPEKAKRLQMYTQNRTSNIDPSLSTSTPTK